MNYINTMNRGWYILASAAAVFLLFLMASTNVSAQSAVACTTATNVANFGADADLFANTPNPDGDDWFSSPTFPGIGQGIIGLTAATAPRQISAAQFNTLITTVAAAKNSSYEQRMAAPYQTVVVTPTGANILLDAVAARDHWTAATPDSSAFLGSNKNGASPLSWQIGISNVSGKTDLIDVGGHVRRFTTSPTSAGELWGYAYATRNVVNGNSYVDFEVYRTAPVFNALTGQVTNSGPAATGGHTAGQFDNSGFLSAPGDLLVMIDYTNGGNVPTASVRVWVNPKTMISGQTFATYQAAINYYNALPLNVKLFDFTGVGASDVATNTNGYGYFEIRPKSGSGCLVYARTNNTSTTGTPWGSVQAGAYQANIAALQLVEVAINFSAFGLDIVPASGPCFNLLGSLLVKTRSSASYSATLEDYAGPYVFGAFAEVNAEAGASKEITCTNPTVTLSGASTTPNANYLWTTSNGNIVSGGTTLSPVVNQPGTYYLRVTNPVLGSCDALDSVVVTLNNQPAAVACTPGPAITCANGSSNLTAVATPTGSNTITGYSWSNGGSAASTSVADANTYTVTVTQSNGCTATSSCNVVVNTCAPTATAANAGDITCTNTSITVSANATACTGETLSYLWSTGASTPTIDVTSGGTYSVTITQTGNGCTTTTSSTVGVNNTAPSVSCNPASNITCSNPTSNLCVTATASGSNSISGYSWTKFGSGTNCVSVNNGDPYTVTVTQSNGCTATATCNAVVDTCRPQITATNNGPITCTNTSRTVSSTATPCLGETVSYAWSNGETGSSFSTSNGGAYTVTVTQNGNGCTASASTTLGVDNSNPSVFCAPAQSITCAASTTELSATATPSSGNSAVSYLWSPGGATTQSITVNNGDTYTVTFTQSNGCTATSSCSAVVDTCRPSVTANNGGPITCTNPTPSVSAIGTACGSATLAYLWNNGQTADNFTTAAAGTYTVTVTQSSNGCTASASTILESNNTNPTITCSANTNITCSTTSVNLNSSANASGTNTITGYSWSTGATTSSIAVSNGDSYTVTVTQSNGCTASSSCAAVVDTCRPTVTAGNNGPITCTDPSITVTANGTACNGESLSYSWSNGNTGASFNTSTAAAYTVTVTHNGNGCSASASTTVSTNNTTPIVSCAPVQSITCSSASTQLTATATPTTGNSAVGYLWSPGGATTQSITVNNGDTYTVTFTQSNGCTATSNCSAVVDTCRPSVTANNGGPITCTTPTPSVSAIGTACGSATLAYLWNNGQTADNFTTAAAGTYSVTVTQSSNGCTASASTILESNNTNPTITCSANTNITCSTTSVNLNSSANASGTNTITGYSWSTGATTSSIAVSNGDSYTVTVTQSNGCTASSSCAAVVDTCRPTVTAGNNGPITCTDPSITVTANGTACNGESLSYSWSNGNTGASFNTSTAAAYTVTVTHNGNGCSASASTTVGTNNTTPIVSCAPAQSITCSSTSTQLTATATPTTGNSAVGYLWSPGGATTQSITVNNGDTYTVTFTQSNGCTATSNCSAVVDTCRPTVTANNNGPITCSNPTPTVSAVGTPCTGETLSYLWNNGQTGENFTSAAAGTYSVTVTQSTNGCTATASTNLESNNTNPTISCEAGANITCSTTSVNLNSSASASGTNTITGYSWSNGATTTSIAVSNGDTYTVTVTQSNGCTASSSCEAFVDTCSPSVIATNAGPVTCTSPSVAVSANGTACNGESLSYSWSNTNTGASFNTSTPGVYTVTVTHNGNGCTASDATTVATNNSTPSVNCTPGADITCTNTSTTLTAVAVAAGANSITSYAWSPGAGNTPTITVNNGATYTITVTQSNGCTASNTCAAVVDNCNPTVTVADPADITCLNTSSTMTAVANACNGDALVYLWNTGSSAGSISESTAGTYTVTVTQSNNGCTATASVDLVVDNCLPTAAASNSGNVDCNNASSTISVAGTPCAGETVTYLWNNGETGSSFTTSTAGTYSVTVTHAGNGCSATDQTTITADVSTPTVTCVANGDITCNTSMVDLDATASASTGNSITSYSWAPGGATSASIPVNDGTSYTVTVTQSNGCTTTSNCAATVNTTTPSCSIAGPVSATCNSGGNNVSATVTDADAGATYSWSIVSGTGYTITSGNTATLTFTAGSGTAVFELTVTNSNGCSSTCNVTVNAVCGERYCTYTQGAYGNAGGTHCNGLTTPAFVAQLIGANPIVIGGNGNQISFGATDVNCLISRLPGGGLSAPLNGPASCSNPVGIAVRNGKFANTLLNQTITLSLNLRINGGALATLPITGIYLTTQASTGGGCGTTGTGIPGTDMVYSIPQSVVNYLTASGNNTVGDLLFLANSALARTYVPSGGTPSLSAIAAAVDAINNAFDECRIFAGFSNMLASTVRSTVPFDETGADAQLEANGIVAKAFPNPFHYTTTIEFTMSNYCANVTVDVFSLNGEKVATLYQGEVNGGQVKRLDFNAEKLADGIYVYRIATNDNVYYDKLILNK